MLKAYACILSQGLDGAKKDDQLVVLNPNNLKELLKDTLQLGYHLPCPHECVFNKPWQQQHGVSTLDIAKRLIDFGFHPPTVYFPLVVPGTIMIEPTETESKDDLDKPVTVFRKIAEQAQNDPAALHKLPIRAKLKGLDETLAARKPCLTS
jgi:glycine dehydrogenase subunit 2